MAPVERLGLSFAPIAAAVSKAISPEEAWRECRVLKPPGEAFNRKGRKQNQSRVLSPEYQEKLLTAKAANRTREGRKEGQSRVRCTEKSSQKSAAKGAKKSS
jgi:hypothetical protein